MISERLDLYRNVHKGIRVMLFDLVQKSGRTDFTDRAAVAQLRSEVADIFELLESHAHTEDRHIMPLVHEHAPALAREFAEAHVDQEARLPELLAALDAIDVTSPDATRKGHAFVLHLSRIAGELMTHMADEELQLNVALWDALTDAELADVEHRLIANIPPEKLMRYLTWMVPNMNSGEQQAFMSMVPPPVAAVIASLIPQRVSA